MQAIADGVRLVMHRDKIWPDIVILRDICWTRIGGISDPLSLVQGGFDVVFCTQYISEDEATAALPSHGEFLAQHCPAAPFKRSA